MYIAPILHCYPALSPVSRVVVREFHCRSCTGIYCSRCLGNQLALPGHLSGQGITLYRPCQEILAARRPNTASKIQQSFRALRTHESLTIPAAVFRGFRGFCKRFSKEPPQSGPISSGVSARALVSTSRPAHLELEGGKGASSSV